MSWEFKRGTVVTKVGVANFQHFQGKFLVLHVVALKGHSKSTWKIFLTSLFSKEILCILLAQGTEKLLFKDRAKNQ